NETVQRHYFNPTLLEGKRFITVLTNLDLLIHERELLILLNPVFEKLKVSMVFGDDGDCI
ncbi:MAG: hypothetical protein ACXACU_13755, partial [Candidatus Hodarchaeales archaeon]